MARKFTLGKEERLKSRKKIDALFKDGQRFSMGPFLVFYRIQDDTLPPVLQAGFNASKKNFKKAVDRNRAKRMMREAYRLQNQTLKETVKAGTKSLDLFIVFTGKILPAYQEVSDKLKPLLHKLQEVYEKK